jgi:hypothetical protein
VRKVMGKNALTIAQVLLGLLGLLGLLVLLADK